MNKEDLDLHEQFSEYGMNAREWTRKCVLLLPEILRRGIWKEKKFGSIYEYAAKLAGMSRSSAEEALRVMKKVEDLPALKQVVEEKGLQSVRPVLAIATKETEKFWAEKARGMSKNTLETYVKNYRSQSLPREASQPAKSSVTFYMKAELASKLEQFKKREDFEELLEEFVSAVEEKTEEEKPAVKKEATRYIPVEIKRFVLKKTGGKCGFPGCFRAATSLHHTQRFALKRVHDPDRLIPVCTAHERIAHLGLIDHEEAAPEKWRVREKADPLDHKSYVDEFVQMYRWNSS